MDIDLRVLRSLEREREISFDLLVDAIESALLIAYQRTEGAKAAPAWSSTARPGTSPCGQRSDAEPEEAPRRAARVRRHARPASAASPPAPPSQVILQRLRDATDEVTSASSPAARATSSSG